MTWVFDSKRFAKKVKHGTSSISNSDPAHEKSCPACGQLVVNDTAMQEWPGLPAGVKFDPNDKELLDHLAAKIGRNGFKPHILIDEFIPTLDGDDGICYTHPEKLPGVKRDGSSSHFFHRPANAYTKGTRKRRKVHTGQNALDGETRWHKTGKTRPVLENGQEIGWKKIMVLYTNFKRKAKPNKTNWVMHQYHLGSQEDEREGELVVSKVFYQTQPRNSSTSKKVNASDDEECDQDGSPASFDGQPQASASAIDGPTSSLARPLPSTPDVVRPWPSREPRIEILEPVPERASTPLSLLTEVSLNVSTPESTRGTLMKCTSNGAVSEETGPGDRSIVGIGPNETFLDLLCNETLHEEPSSFADSHLAQNFRSFAADLGLTLDEDAGDLDNIVLGTPPDFLEDPIVSSQELWDWFGKRNSGPSSQERGNSQSGT